MPTNQTIADILSRRTKNRAIALLYVVASLVAVILKLNFNHVSPERIQWLLSPTTTLVQMFTALNFYFDSSKGWMAINLPVIIGSDCAGLNFFVIAFCMGVFSFAAYVQKHYFGWLIFFLLTGYLITILANACRIVAGIVLLSIEQNLDLNPSASLHTYQGSLFYFVFLVIYFYGLRAFFRRRARYEISH